jgi:hypothetical protein
MLEMSIRQEHRTHATWRTHLATQSSADEHAAIRRSTHTGRPPGTPEFIEAQEKAMRRKLAPNKGGRPETARKYPDQIELDF